MFSKNQRGNGRHQLVGVQALRGIAALLVVFVHYNGTAVSHGFGFPVLADVELGHIGVDIFFVISGFIMELTAGGQPYVKGDTSRFLYRRAVRVLPLYWVLTLVAFGITLVLGSEINARRTPQQFMMSMLLLPAADTHGQAVYVIAVAWTLTFELYFYLIFAALLRLKTSTRLVLLAALFTASSGIGFLANIQDPLAHVFVDPIVFEFLLGCLLAYALRHRWALGQHTGWLIAAAAVSAMLLQARLLPSPGMRFIFWGLPAAALVGVVALSAGSIAIQLERPFIYLGNISYSLYLSHFFTIALFVRIHKKLPAMFANSKWFCLCALLLLILAIAHACYISIERPFQLWLSRKGRANNSTPQLGQI